MAKVTNILAGDGFRGDISSIVSTTTAEEKKKLRDQFFKDLMDNAVAVPVGIAEGAVGLPGDLEGLVRGVSRAYNAEDGERLDAFGSAFADTTLPSTQQIQNWTNNNLFDNELGDMVRRGKYGRLAGEFVAPTTIITAPIKSAKSLAKGAGVLSDNKFFNAISNPANVDVAPAIVNKADDVLSKVDDVYDPLKEIDSGAIKANPRYYEDAQNYYDYFNPDKVPEANHLGYFEPHYGPPKDNPLDYLHGVTERTSRSKHGVTGTHFGERIPKDTPVQPASNTFYDDIRVNEPLPQANFDDLMNPENSRDSFEFIYGGKGDHRGGPVTIRKNLNEPYVSTYKDLPPTDNPFRGPATHRYIGGRHDNGVKFDSFFPTHISPVKDWKPPKAKKADKAIEYLQRKTKQTPTTGITPARAEGLISGEIKLPEPRNTTVDPSFTMSTERPYDTTQFIRDTQGKDGDFFARLARENSREYGGMFKNTPPESGDIVKHFERTPDPRYRTPHTGKFVQEIRSTPNGNYNKLDLGKTNVQSTKDLQKQVDTAVDIANNKVRYASAEDRYNAFIDAMEKIEEVNAKYVRRGKPTKVKEDVMNYLYQIHDDIMKDVMKSKDTLLPQRTANGTRMFEDSPRVNRDTNGEMNWDELMQHSAETSDRIQY